MEKENETLYQLKSPFEYAFKGEERTANFISLSAPTMKQHHESAKLQQSIMTMVRDEYKGNDDGSKKTTSNDDGNGNDDDITSDMILTLMFCSKNVDINVMFEQAKTLFKSGVALIDGEQKLTSPLIEKMSIDDFQNLTGDYIVNFILA